MPFPGILHGWSVYSPDNAGHTLSCRAAIMFGYLPGFRLSGSPAAVQIRSGFRAGSLALSSASPEEAQRGGRLGSALRAATLGLKESQHHQAWVVNCAGVQASRQRGSQGRGAGRGHVVREASCWRQQGRAAEMG